MDDSDTSLQDLEDELFDRHKVVTHQKRASLPNSTNKDTSTSVSSTNNKISLQGAKWSPLPNRIGPISGIPTIAVRVQPKPPPPVVAAVVKVVQQPTPVRKIINGNSIVVTGKMATKPAGQVPPIIVFPNSNSSPVILQPVEPPVKTERLENASKSAAITPVSPKKVQLNRAEFLKTSEASSRLVNLTLQRFIAKPANPPPAKQAKVDYTICSACKKIVESNRLALHVALDHGSSPAKLAQQQGEQSEVPLQQQQQDATPPNEVAVKPPLPKESSIENEHDYGNSYQGCCPLCNRRISKDRYSAHIQLVHHYRNPPGSNEATETMSTEEMARKPFQCLVCSSRFALRRTLIRHQQFCGSTDPNAKSHMCETCGACFYDPRFLQSHMTRAHTSHFDCDECDASFPLKRYLQEHKIAKHRKRAPAGCGKSKRKKPAVAENIELGNSNLTAESNSEVQHEKADEDRVTDDRVPSPSKQDDSNEKSPVEPQNEVPDQPSTPPVDSQQESLPDDNATAIIESPPRDEPKARKRTWKRAEGSTGPPWICRICGKKCKTQADLNDHEDMHNGIRRHTCDKCDKAYTFKSALWVHRQKHENEDSGQQFGCEFCLEMFKTKQTLLRHKTLKHPESVDAAFSEMDQVTCEICQKTFKNQAALRMHIARGHPRNAASSSQHPAEKEDEERDEDDVPLEIDEGENGDESDVEMDDVEEGDFSTLPLVSHVVSAMSESEPMMCEDARQAPLLLCPTDDENVANELCLV